MEDNKSFDQYARYKSRADAIYETRRFRHDFKNHLIALKSLIDSGNTKRASEYADSLLGRLEEAGKGARTYSDNVIADAVFSVLAEKCEASGIDFDAEAVFGGFDIDDVELCAVLSNLADNAYEAALKAPPGKRLIRFFVSRREKWFIINEENSFGGNIYLTDGDIPPSSKGDAERHGFGLKNVKEIASAHGGKVEINIDEKEQMFYISVIFPR